MIVKLCPSGKYSWKNKWKPYTDLDELFLELFGKNVKDSGVKRFDVNPGIQREFNIMKNGKKVKVKLEVTLSPNVAKENSQYFEGILQVRNTNEEIIDYIRNETDKQRVKGVYITKEIPLKNGVDFQMTNQTYIKTLANKLKRVFGGVISLNPQLFSRNRQSSKDLFRLNLVLTFPTIKKNDVIVCKETPWKVISVQDKINVTSFTGKKSSLPFKKYTVLEKKETRVVQIQPSLEIMDPETYQNSSVKNPILKHDSDLKIDQKVKVVFYEGWWISNR